MRGPNVVADASFSGVPGQRARMFARTSCHHLVVVMREARVMARFELVAEVGGQTSGENPGEGGAMGDHGSGLDAGKVV
jgi:hypothetical protein